MLVCRRDTDPEVGKRLHRRPVAARKGQARYTGVGFSLLAVLLE